MIVQSNLGFVEEFAVHRILYNNLQIGRLRLPFAHPLGMLIYKINGEMIMLEMFGHTH